MMTATLQDVSTISPASPVKVVGNATTRERGRWLASGLHSVGIRANAECIIFCCSKHANDREAAIAATSLLGCSQHVFVPDVIDLADIGPFGHPTVVLACPEGEVCWSAATFPGMVIGANVGALWWRQLELRGKRELAAMQPPLERFR
jgi:hypothetical protein